MGKVDSLKVHCSVVEGREPVEGGVLHQGLEGAEEGRAKPVRAQTACRMHLPQGDLDF